MKSLYDQYQICKIRSHEDSGLSLDSLPPWHVCKHCGCWYRYETKLIEGNIPEPETQKETTNEKNYTRADPITLTSTGIVRT